ncbi:hypothetical protein CRUP_020127 [Coryphaenoides rupestris]|nr:hypothetical protein CRUP_020127 [Coryphaenoides rupestris]
MAYEDSSSKLTSYLIIALVSVSTFFLTFIIIILGLRTSDFKFVTSYNDNTLPADQTLRKNPTDFEEVFGDLDSSPEEAGELDESGDDVARGFGAAPGGLTGEVLPEHNAISYCFEQGQVLGSIGRIKKPADICTSSTAMAGVAERWDRKSLSSSSLKKKKGRGTQTPRSRNRPMPRAFISRSVYRAWDLARPPQLRSAISTLLNVCRVGCIFCWFMVE